MPHYKVMKVPNKNCYKVMNDKTKVVVAKCATLKNAKEQAKLLNMMDHRTVSIKRKM